MNWYHQPPNGKMTEIISMFSDRSSNKEGRYALSLHKGSKLLKLTITGLTPADTGVYFCSVGEVTQWEEWQGGPYKNPLGSAWNSHLLQDHRRKQPTGQEKGRQKARWVALVGLERKLMNVLTTILPHLVSKRVVVIRSQPQEHFLLGNVVPKNITQLIEIHICLFHLPNTHPPFLVTTPGFSLDNQATHPPTHVWA